MMMQGYDLPDAWSMTHWRYKERWHMS